MPIWLVVTAVSAIPLAAVVGYRAGKDPAALDNYTGHVLTVHPGSRTDPLTVIAMAAGAYLALKHFARG